MKLKKIYIKTLGTISGLISYISPRTTSIHNIMNDIVAASINPKAYTEFDIEDNFEGRLEHFILICALVLQHLKTIPEAIDISQQLVDAIFSHIDDALRRIGTSDVSMGRKMKKIAGNFYGRLEAYDNAFKSGDDVLLREALARNIYSGKKKAEEINHAFILKIKQYKKQLQEKTLDNILNGNIMNSII